MAAVGSQIGAGGPTATLNDGRMFIALKPHSERKASADEVINRLRPKTRQAAGHHPLHAGGAGHHDRRTALANPISIYPERSRPRELDHWSALFLDKLRSIPGIVDVASDQQNAGPLLDITINRDVASSYGILPATIDKHPVGDAFGQRIVSSILTQQNQYHVVLEVQPQFQFGPSAMSDIYLDSSSGQQVPLSTLVTTRREGLAAGGQPSGSVPLDHHLVQPAARHGHRQRGVRHPAGGKAIGQAGFADHQFPGQRTGFPVVAGKHAAFDRGRAGRDLHHSGRAV